MFSPNVQTSEYSQLQHFAQDLNDRLNAAELRANQLSNQGTQQDTHNALLKTQEEKADLESKLAQVSCQRFLSKSCRENLPESKKNLRSPFKVGS